MLCWLFLLTFFLPPPPLTPTRQLEERPFVKGILNNQLGNQMFQIATALSLAWDNNAEAIFPELLNDNKIDWWKFTTNHRYVFWRLNTKRAKRKAAFFFSEQGLRHQSIPFVPDMEICGNFQSEKYFAHHKEELLELFEPHESLTNYILEKFPWITSENTVAVHVRCYWPNFNGNPDGQGVLPSLSPHWFERAILTFPADSLFVVFSNNIPWCKQHLKHIPRQLVYVEGQPHFIDLFAMSMCQHNIISNSSFSWWGAYLNKNPTKIVIGPKTWFTKESGLDSSDIMPEGWHVLQ